MGCHRALNERGECFADGHASIKCLDLARTSLEKRAGVGERVRGMRGWEDGYVIGNLRAGPAAACHHFFAPINLNLDQQHTEC